MIGRESRAPPRLGGTSPRGPFSPPFSPEPAPVRPATSATPTHPQNLGTVLRTPAPGSAVPQSPPPSAPPSPAPLRAVLCPPLLHVPPEGPVLCDGIQLWLCTPAMQPRTPTSSCTWRTDLSMPTSQKPIRFHPSPARDQTTALSTAFPVSGQGSLSLQILTPNLQQSFWRSCLLHSRSRQTASLRPSPLPRIWTPDSARGLPVARPLVVQSPTATGRTCSCAFLKLQ